MNEKRKRKREQTIVECHALRNMSYAQIYRSFKHSAPLTMSHRHRLYSCVQDRFSNKSRNSIRSILETLYHDT